MMFLLIGLAVLVSFLSMIVNRQRAFPKARVMLNERLHLGLAVRTKNYDLYLPNKCNINNDDNPNERQTPPPPMQALLFLPGALVEHTAYAGLASRLADGHGILVAVINLEPTRLAYTSFPCLAPSRLIRLTQEIERHVLESSRTNTTIATTTTDNTARIVWSIGGHSLVRIVHMVAVFLVG